MPGILSSSFSHCFPSIDTHFTCLFRENRQKIFFQNLDFF
ncbi:hypothetical protein T4A_399 [Trichinella pseudospiralis]|uniref:Uncharacterized protein n=1 Tax=Trichinella pseudospiralis TaxID=6337 RepID=A0A0V1C517_TRIPS|nr:hypothetical protein T4A_399 [Trichinella pseudospiralis]